MTNYNFGDVVLVLRKLGRLGSKDIEALVIILQSILGK
jgi:hypothetical protein